MTKQKKIFVGMTYVRDDYKGTGLTDIAFAELISKRTGVSYSRAEIRAYRASLGIPNNTPRDARDHKIIQLQNTLNEVWVYLLEINGGIKNMRGCQPDIVKQYEEAMK